jgi:hypothetical protein
MWQEITDIKEFMDEIYWFHDSFLKELKYLGGSYTTPRHTMYLCDDVRSARMLFCGYPNDFEVEFKGVTALHLQPRLEKYSTEIYEATFISDNGLLYWAESEEFDVESSNEYKGTWLCAKSARWRKRKKNVGVEPVYIDSEFGAEDADFFAPSSVRE